MEKLRDIKEFTEKERLIYKKLQNKFKGNKRKIVAIKVDSGDYFIGEDELEAAQKAKSKFADKVFVFFRIGYPPVHKIRSNCLL
jgi:guanylate kinase